MKNKTQKYQKPNLGKNTENRTKKFSKYSKSKKNLDNLEISKNDLQDSLEQKNEQENKLELVAKKRFGQNFLVNIGVKDKVKRNIKNLVDEYSQINNLLEIGPGKGDITDFLLDLSRSLNKKFTAIEIDPEAILFLQNKFGLNKKNEIEIELQADSKTTNSLDKNIGNEQKIQNIELKTRQSYKQKLTQKNEEIRNEEIRNEEIRKNTNFQPNSLLNYQTKSPVQAQEITSLENDSNNSQTETFADNCAEITENNLDSNSKTNELGSKLNSNYTDSWLQSGDALQLTNSKNLPFEDFVLFSSLPYNVASRILVDLAIGYPFCPFCVIVQKEVAVKLIDDKLTFFGAFLRLFYDFDKVFDISGGSFDPAPKVMSSLLVARPKFITNSNINSSPKTDLNSKKEVKKLPKTVKTNLKISKSGENLDQKSNENLPNLQQNLSQNSLKTAELELKNLAKINFTNFLNNLLLLENNRQNICQILKKLVANPRKTLANNLLNLEWKKEKIEDFITKNNYQKTRLLYSNYQEILLKILAEN